MLLIINIFYLLSTIFANYKNTNIFLYNKINLNLTKEKKPNTLWNIAPCMFHGAGPQRVHNGPSTGVGLLWPIGRQANSCEWKLRLPTPSI